MSFWHQGGFFFFAIGFLGFLVLLMSIERLWRLKFQYALNARAFLQKIKKTLELQDAVAAEEVCQSQKGRPLAHVLEKGLKARLKSLDEVHLAIEAEIAFWIPLIERRVNALGTLANIATLLGLVGTVLGLIKAFGALGGDLVANATRSQALASGVSESMLTTAAGLIVAIPALLAHLYLSGLARRLIGQIDYGALELKKMIYEYKQTHSSLRQSSIKPLRSPATDEKVGVDELTSSDSQAEDFWKTKPERKS